MKQERLLEITSTISKLDGPLVVLGYLTSLKESDMYLFLNCVKGSKYGSLDFYRAIKMFSDEYVSTKEVIADSSSLKELGYTSVAKDWNGYDYGFKSDYYEKYTMNDGDVKISSAKR